MESFHNMHRHQPIPVPRIRINDTTAHHQPSPRVSAATNSSNSFTNFNDQFFDLDSISPHSASSQPYNVPISRPRATSSSSSDPQPLEYFQDLAQDASLPALSCVGSIHTSRNIPHQQTQQREAFSGFAYANQYSDPYSGLGVVPQNIPAYSPPIQSNDAATSAAESDGYSFVERDCPQCQTKDDRLDRLEIQVQSLSNQLQGYEQTLRDQHQVIKSQELFILSLEQQSKAQTNVQNRKRRLPALHQEVTDPSDSHAQASALSAKRGRFPPQQRKQTAETRQKGACVRCWKHKQRCVPGADVDGRCKNCQEPSLGLIRIPCIRTHIVDLNLFRCGTGRNDTWTQRDDVEKPTDLSTYTSEERKHLILTHGFGPELNVKVRRYRPVRNDTVVYTWRDGQGQMRYKTMPEYALSDIEELTVTIQSYIDENQDAYIQQFVQHGDVPTQEAFRIARKLAANDKSLLLRKALQLWTAARLIEKPWQICGDETLGLEADNHWWWMPVTPIMDTQLDQVVIKAFLLPLRRDVLQMLQSKVEKACRQSWLEIFITIVILLNTIEEATRHDHEFATFFGHEYEPGRRRFEDYKLIESYFHSALTLLTHVKVAFDGRLPYLDAKTDVSKLMAFCQDEDEQDYMIETDRYVGERKRKVEFEKIRDRHHYEAEQFWVHQLFLRDWEGKPISINEK